MAAGPNAGDSVDAKEGSNMDTNKSQVVDCKEDTRYLPAAMWPLVMLIFIGGQFLLEYFLRLISEAL